MNIENILEERQKTHGTFTTHAELSQKLKEHVHSRPEWRNLSFSQREAIDMILHKIARVINGNPNEADHWQDISGYATLVLKELEGK